MMAWFSNQGNMGLQKVDLWMGEEICKRWDGSRGQSCLEEIKTKRGIETRFKQGRMIISFLGAIALQCINASPQRSAIWYAFEPETRFCRNVYDKRIVTRPTVLNREQGRVLINAWYLRPTYVKAYAICAYGLNCKQCISEVTRPSSRLKKYSRYWEIDDNFFLQQLENCRRFERPLDAAHCIVRFE